MLQYLTQNQSRRILRTSFLALYITRMEWRISERIDRSFEMYDLSVDGDPHGFSIKTHALDTYGPTMQRPPLIQKREKMLKLPSNNI